MSSNLVKTTNKTIKNIGQQMSLMRVSWRGLLWRPKARHFRVGGHQTIAASSASVVHNIRYIRVSYFDVVFKCLIFLLAFVT